MSDVGLGVSVALPAVFAIGSTFDEAAGDRALVYAQSLAGTLVVTSLTKALVGRPRPYVYNADPAIKRWAAGQRDAYHSFYSGHAATAFASAAAGGALYATREPDVRARALVWGASVASAAMTADLRVRAGKHFYSDVLVGAVVGAGIGTLIPALHQDTYRVPTGLELGAMAGGLVAGVTFAELVPVESGAGLVPLFIDGGGGIALAGRLR
jgi:membrane-associated phospholipid phosphatase